MESPNFFAIIPANVRYADIMPNAKLLYWEITALSNKTGFCYASNAYFANLYGVSSRQIINWINQLEKFGFIVREVEKDKGNYRYISIVNKTSQPSEENFTTLVKKTSQPSEEKDTLNNTFIITDNNTKNIIIKDQETKKINDNEIIDNIDDLRRFLNKWKLQERFYYKIGTEESYERFTSDFFIFCDEKGREMKKKTVEAKFIAYLQPSWEKDEDVKEMILNYNRKKQKETEGKIIMKDSVELEKKEKEKNIDYILWEQIEKTLSEDEKKEFEKIKEDVEKWLSILMRWRKLNPLIIKGAYYSRIWWILKK